MESAPTPTLLLTRPLPASERFLSRLETALGHRVSAVLSPVLRIEETGNVPDLHEGETVICTSSNAVRIAADAGLLSGRNCLTVGQATAAAADAAGAEVICLGETVEAFLAAAAERDPVSAIHLRGTHTRGNLVGSLQALGWDARDAILYDQVAEPPSRAAVALVSDPGQVVIPLFSPRSAKLASVLGHKGADLQVLALSQAVAEAWTGGGVVTTLNIPSAEAMLSEIAQAFRRPHLGLAPGDD